MATEIDTLDEIKELFNSTIFTLEEARKMIADLLCMVEGLSRVRREYVPSEFCEKTSKLVIEVVDLRKRIQRAVDYFKAGRAIAKMEGAVESAAIYDNGISVLTENIKSAGKEGE